MRVFHSASGGVTAGLQKVSTTVRFGRQDQDIEVCPASKALIQNALTSLIHTVTLSRYMILCALPGGPTLPGFVCTALAAAAAPSVG